MTIRTAQALPAMLTPNPVSNEIESTPAITNWQTCLRDLLNPPTIIPNEIPPWVPIRAGGKGAIPTHENPWTGEDCHIVHLGVLSGQLLPHEAAFLTGRFGKQIREFLELLGITLPPCPAWVPEWARTAPTHNYCPDWTLDEIRSLNYYWQLNILGIEDISNLLNKPLEETEDASNWLGLQPKPPKEQAPEWCGPSWNFQANSPSDPKFYETTLQHRVAEASATRFALLYRSLDELSDTSLIARKIQRELDRILTLHTRIFDKYLSVKSRKYTQCSPTPAQTLGDLEQVGRTAIFECLRRWHPNRKVRFSRAAVCIAITREMIAWLESQRLVALPDKIRSVARKLKAARDSGDMQATYDRLALDNGARCVDEASKHQDTYAYVTTVPLMDEYSEGDADSGGIHAYSTKSENGFETYHEPTANTDIHNVIFQATEKLNPPEKRAILAYYGIQADGGHSRALTLEEIGANEGVTKERIRQRLAKARERMRRWFEAHQIYTLTDAFADT